MNSCVFCGGTVENKSVAFIYDEEENYFVIEHVPAEVCTKCGEKTYSPEITDAIYNIARHKVNPLKTIKVPVFDLAGAGV